MCYQRFGLEILPGCTGTSDPAYETEDFCVYRPPDYLLWVAKDVNLTAGDAPLGPCEGDCDGDGDCAGELICEKRGGYETVPGCRGMGRWNFHYCRWPDGYRGGTAGPTAGPTDAVSYSPSFA